MSGTSEREPVADRMTVTVHPSGRQFTVAAGASILDAALDAGLALPYGCRNGACRSCRARVLSGSIAYPGAPPRGVDPLDDEHGFVLLCAAEARSDAAVEIEELDAYAAISVRTLPCRLVGKHALSHDVMRLRFALQAGERLPHLAGQYLDVVLRDGRRRAFSIATPPGADHFDLHIRRVPDGRFSEYVFDHLKERAILRIHGPLGSFYLRRDENHPVILVAGGTGFAPIKSIVEDALGSGFDRPLHLYWGARARRDLYLDDLAREWAARWPNLTYTPVLSEPDAEDAWNGRTGFVHHAVLDDWPDLADHAAYLSGPPPMVAAGRAGFIAAGLPAARLHSDAFDYAYETGHE